MGGILSDLEIRAAVASGDIEIDPFTESQLNITSYDLTLGDEVRVYSEMVSGTPSYFFEGDASGLARYIQGQYLRPAPLIPHISMDSKLAQRTEAWKFDDSGLILKPGIGYLLHTRERVKTNRFNPILDGKSSIGRLFLQVHATAGYGDPGFNGQYTLEVIATHPVRVYPGMRFCQIRFHTISGELGKTYDQVGHYTEESARGAVASQAWKQFR